MKKTLFIAACAALAFGVLSCSKDNGASEEPVIESVDPEEEVLEAEAQGKKLAGTATSLAEAINTKDFTDAFKTIGELVNTDWSKYECEDNEDLLEKLEEACVIYKSGASVDEYLVDLSGARGRYVSKNGKITVTESDNVEISLEEGYDALVTFSDKTSKVLVSSVWKNNVREADYYAEIPEEITATVSYKGVQQIKVTMTSGLNVSGSVEEFDFNQDSFDIALSIEVAGYKIAVTKACYKNHSAQVVSALYKGEQCLLSESASASGIKFYQGELSNIDDVNLSVNVMGMVQVKGKVNDAIAVVEAINSLDGKTDEKSAKDIANTLNSNVDVKVYYGSDVVQAALVFQAMTTDSAQTRWTAMPVIKIGDQTYALSEYEKILSDAQISSITDAFESLCEDFYELVEKYVK